MIESLCNRLDEFLGGELALDRCSEFEKHLADCPSCSLAVEDWRALRRTLQAATHQLESPSRALVERIERGPAPPRPNAAPDGRIWRVAALLAASILAAALFRAQPRPASKVGERVTSSKADRVATTLSPPTNVQFAGDVIGVPIDIGDPRVTVVWLYPEARVADREN